MVGMLFLKLSNADMLFCKETLILRPYSINKALFITKQVQIIDKTGFVIAALDEDGITFIVHKIIKNQKEMAIDFIKKAQIKA